MLNIPQVTMTVQRKGQYFKNSLRERIDESYSRFLLLPFAGPWDFLSSPRPPESPVGVTQTPCYPDALQLGRGQLPTATWARPGCRWRLQNADAQDALGEDEPLSHGGCEWERLIPCGFRGPWPPSAGHRDLRRLSNKGTVNSHETRRGKAN